MPDTLRAMSYNILFGGIDAQGDRLPLLTEVVNGAQPDILALCECKGFLEDGGARRDAFCEAVGMRGSFVDAPSWQHVGLLYREPWTPTDVRAIGHPMTHGLVYVSLQHPDGRRLDALATHLDPYSSLFRLAEAQVVLSRLVPGVDLLVMGDLNSLPVGTWSGVRAHRLLDLQMQPDTEVARYFASAGLIDVLAHHRIAAPTYPTPLDPKPDDYGPGVRLDYILASRALAKRCTAASVLDTPLANRASDHLPILAEFTFE